MSLDAGQTFTDKVYLSENNRAVSSQKKLINGIIDKAVLVGHLLEQRQNATGRNYVSLTFRKGLEIISFPVFTFRIFRLSRSISILSPSSKSLLTPLAAMG